MTELFKESWRNLALKEAKDLCEKIRALEAFLFSPESRVVPTEHLVLMEEQLEYMRQYLKVLSLRIGYFITEEY